MSRDVEKGSLDKDFTPSPDYSSGSGNEPNYEETTVHRASIPRRVWDSFKPDQTREVMPKTVDGRVLNLQGAVHATAHSLLARRLKGRHLQMIAIGGSIGE